MTTSSQGGSAAIYQFPARGRFAVSAVRDESKSAINPMPPGAAKVVFGSGWYHDEAIQEAERARTS